MPQLSIHSPLGSLTLTDEGGAIIALDWGWGRDQEETPLLINARRWIEEYFDGEVTTRFDLPVSPMGTPYQKRIWSALAPIPAGSVRTYGELAAEAGGSPRSVGLAAGANPIPILIPCHRLVGKSQIGGYSGDGGVDDKRFLLALEGVSYPENS